MPQKKMIKGGFKKFSYKPLGEEEQLRKAKSFYQEFDLRRSIREFSSQPIAQEVIEKILLTASSAPSGAHKQPWTFAIVKNQEIKKQIREAAEKEEYDNYHGRMSDAWLKDLEKFDTNWQKPFLEIAPILIIVFKKSYDLEGNDKQKNYYVNESVGIATGFLLAAIHNAGLVALTHTPSPMNFLSQILNRPENEKPFLLIPVGYPSPEAVVPIIKRKNLEEIMIEY